VSSPSFRCGASIFCTQGRVQGLPAVGRPGEDAGDAAHGSVPDTAAATLEAAGDGQERDLDLLHVALVQWIPRLVNRRRDPGGGEAQRARPGRVVLAAARRPTRVSKKISEWRRWDAVEALDVAAAAAKEPAGWVRRRSYGGGRGRGERRRSESREEGERCVSEGDLASLCDLVKERNGSD
jgi:hypothetical protein